MFDVVALGELLIDFASKSVNAEGYPVMEANPGGAPGNFLAALNAYGAKTAFIGKVGDDIFGHLLIRTLKKAGIDTGAIVIDPHVFTTLAFVTFDQNGERSFGFSRKPGADAALCPDEIPRQLLGETKIFHFGSLSLTNEPVRSATREAVHCAKTKGALITFDPNFRAPLWGSEDAARREILWGISQADILKISDEEVRFLWDCAPEEGANRLLNEANPSLVMVTMGKKGALLKTKNASVKVACPPVTAVDTTGAGDIFGGSAVAKFLETQKAIHQLNEKDLASIGRFATTAASLSTETRGGIPSIPDRARVSRRIWAMQEK